MPLTFEKFNPDTDTREYLKLIDDNMSVIRGKFVQSFLKRGDKSQLSKFLKSSELFTIKADGEVAGFLVYTLKNPSALFIEQLQLKPQFRGQGFGTRALEFVEAKAKEAGCVQLALAVYASNSALHLYQRFGFKKVGYFRLVCWWIYNMRKNI